MAAFSTTAVAAIFFTEASAATGDAAVATGAWTGTTTAGVGDGPVAVCSFYGAATTVSVLMTFLKSLAAYFAVFSLICWTVCLNLAAES